MTFGLVGLLIFPMLVVAVWLYSIRGGAKTDYLALYKQSLESRGTEGVNGWDALLHAAETLSEWDEELFGSDDENDDASELSQGESEELFARIDFSMASSYDADDHRLGWLRESSATLDGLGISEQLDELATAAYFLLPIETGIRKPADDSTDLFSELLEVGVMGRCRRLITLSVARMRLAALDGDEDGILRAWGHSLGAARASYSQGFSIGMLVHASLSILIHSEMQYLLTEQHQSVVQSAKSLLEVTERLDQEFDIESIALHESYYAKDWLQWNYTGGPGSLGYERVRVLDERLAVPKVWGVRRGEIESRIEDILGWVGGVDHLPPSQRGVSRAPSFFGDDPREPWSRDSWNFHISLWQASRCREGATRIMLALEVYRKNHGAYPDSLEELTPGILNELPNDPLAPDGAYRYTRIDPSTDQHQRAYLLYTVALDGTDNAGAVLGNQFEVLSPWKGIPGSDFIFNRPRVIEPANP